MTIDIDTIHLAVGAHASPDDGMCLLEAVAYVVGEPFSDHPECVSTVIAAFGRSWNDCLPAVTARGRPVSTRVCSIDGCATAENARKTHCPAGHAYDGVYRGERICRTCKRLRESARRAKGRAA